jgi:hypothetical protein
MSTIVQPLSNLSSFAYLYVLGGDTYVTDFSDYNYIPGQIDTQWENGYKNDGKRLYFPFYPFFISCFSKSGEPLGLLGSGKGIFAYELPPIERFLDSIRRWLGTSYRSEKKKVAPTEV